jgi:hypothetical protein
MAGSCQRKTPHVRVLSLVGRFSGWGRCFHRQGEGEVRGNFGRKKTPTPLLAESLPASSASRAGAVPHRKYDRTPPCCYELHQDCHSIKTVTPFFHLSIRNTSHFGPFVKIESVYISNLIEPSRSAWVLMRNPSTESHAEVPLIVKHPTHHHVEFKKRRRPLLSCFC